ncbi:MAG: hypothetical protein JSW72_06560, partial [Candidatus Bathyarchaeota archaeon]
VDDGINPPTTIFVVPGNMLNTVYFTVRQDYTYIQIWRSEHEALTYTRLALVRPGDGVYVDGDVMNGQTYYYRVTALNEGGAESGLSQSSSGTPGEDTDPPTGFLLINYGAETTNTIHVNLTLSASEDAVEMMISNTPTFDGAEWEPYNTDKPWILEAREGRRTVWALFRDEAGNEGGGSGLGSSAAYDNINYVQAAIESCDLSGARKDTFNLTDVIYINGTGYSPSETFIVYVVEDVASWSDGMSIPSRIPGTATTVTSNPSGEIPPTAVWSTDLAEGTYDIIVDVNGNGLYDFGVDALDDNDIEVTAGLLIIPEFPTAAISAVALMLTTLPIVMKKRRLPKPQNPTKS